MTSISSNVLLAAFAAACILVALPASGAGRNNRLKRASLPDPPTIRCKLGEFPHLTIQAAAIIQMELEDAGSDANRLSGQAVGCQWKVGTKSSEIVQLLIEVQSDLLANETDAFTALDLKITGVWGADGKYGQPVRMSSHDPVIFILNSEFAAAVVSADLTSQYASAAARRSGPVRLRIVVIKPGFCGHASLVHSGSACYGVRHLAGDAIGNSSGAGYRLAHFASSEQLQQFVSDVTKHNRHHDGDVVNLTDPALTGMLFSTADDSNVQVMQCNCTASLGTSTRCLWERFDGLNQIKVVDWDSTLSTRSVCLSSINSTGTGVGVAPTLTGCVSIMATGGKVHLVLLEIPERPWPPSLGPFGCRGCDSRTAATAAAVAPQLRQDPEKQSAMLTLTMVLGILVLIAIIGVSAYWLAYKAIQYLAPRFGKCAKKDGDPTAVRPLSAQEDDTRL